MKKDTKFFCRFCKNRLIHTVVDLGTSPVANNLVKPQDIAKPEAFYMLKVFVCEKCFLVQVPNLHTQEEIFSDEYTYFSSYSSSWLSHVQKYTEMMILRFGLQKQHKIVELASNDGYLLQYFQKKQMNVLGIEPCKNVAEAAREKGIPTISEFFGTKLAAKLVRQKKTADLLIANNVIAHVPDINDFVKGMKMILAKNGIFTCEFAHVLKLMQLNQFDTIYHEHFAYYSFLSVRKIFKHHGLTLFDVEELPSHGGSLRLFGRHSHNSALPVSARVTALLKKEKAYGLHKLATYTHFQERVKKVKQDSLEFFIKAKRQGKNIVGYGAPAKGNTFLNYCGIGTEFIDYTVDASPHKQKHFLPGIRIPILDPKMIAETKPDFVLILPWNLRTEIVENLKHIRDWGGKFVVAIPSLEIF